MVKQLSLSGGIKQRMFYDVSGKSVTEYLLPIIKARKETRPARPTVEAIADEMTRLLKTKYPTEKISVSLVSFWIKEIRKGR